MSEPSARREPRSVADADRIASDLVERTNGNVRLALPLGLGKANTIVNALTRSALADPSIELSIFTALTLERPIPSSQMERRFLEPAMDRLFGRYPALIYAMMLHDGSLPDNIAVSEFFLLAGRWLGVDRVQQNYISANYTDALDCILDRRPNVVAQLLARDPGGRLSLSCNTDLTIDLLDRRRDGDADFLFAGEINSQLPFMGGSGECEPADVDILLDDLATDFELFSVAKQPVSLADHAIGLNASRLVRDGGTLQMGIGSVGDSLANALLLRHEKLGVYEDVQRRSPFATARFMETGAFRKGLYGLTEMLTDGLLHLFEAGIIRREVDGAAIHAGFFVGARSFYDALRSMPDDRRSKIAMSSISFTNALDGAEQEKRRARVDARFVNNAMTVTLLGATVSDALETGQVVSGVGGQHDFVAQAFALKGARSVIVLNATRQDDGKPVSNIVWSCGHETLPRHLADIVVTEYGIADLRGRPDGERIAAILAIADSRFQDGLLEKARNAGKIADTFTLPQAQRHNTPECLEQWLAPLKARGFLPPFPFGTDFTAAERRLLPALGLLKQAAVSKAWLTRLAWAGLRGPRTDEHRQCLTRMKLEVPAVSERLSAALLAGALRKTDNGGSP